jgi:hypothetical protein
MSGLDGRRHTGCGEVDRAVRRKRISSIWRMWSCINVSGLWLERRAPGHRGCQRACVLITGQASTGPFGSPGFARAGKTDPPSRLTLSQTSAGNGWVSRHGRPLIQFLCSCHCRSFVPACIRCGAPRAGAVKVGRCTGLSPDAVVSRPHLDGTEHGATLMQAGARAHVCSRSRSFSPC